MTIIQTADSFLLSTQYDYYQNQNHYQHHSVSFAYFTKKSIFYLQQPYVHYVQKLISTERKDSW